MAAVPCGPYVNDKGVTVFKHKDGRGYGWCINTSRPRFARRRYATEALALEALLDALGW
jgi:hypothetical protein